MDSPPSVRTQMRALSVVDLCYVLNDIIIFFASYSCFYPSKQIMVSLSQPLGPAHGCQFSAEGPGHRQARKRTLIVTQCETCMLSNSLSSCIAPFCSFRVWKHFFCRCSIINACSQVSVNPNLLYRASRLRTITCLIIWKTHQLIC